MLTDKQTNKKQSICTHIHTQTKPTNQKNEGKQKRLTQRAKESKNDMNHLKPKLTKA